MILLKKYGIMIKKDINTDRKYDLSCRSVDFLYKIWYNKRKKPLLPIGKRPLLLKRRKNMNNSSCFYRSEDKNKKIGQTMLNDLK